MTWPEKINEPEYEYRVTIENSQDAWEYVVLAQSERVALALAQDNATADGWNGATLGEPRIERLS